MSNISTCEAVELVRNAIDPYSMMGISADDMVYASVKRHMLSLFEKPEGECLHRISFAEFADKRRRQEAVIPTQATPFNTTLSSIPNSYPIYARPLSKDGLFLFVGLRICAS